MLTGSPLRRHHLPRLLPGGEPPFGRSVPCDRSRSALVVSHHCDGFLQDRVASMLQLATSRGSLLDRCPPTVGNPTAGAQQKSRAHTLDLTRQSPRGPPAPLSSAASPPVLPWWANRWPGLRQRADVILIRLALPRLPGWSAAGDHATRHLWVLGPAAPRAALRFARKQPGSPHARPLASSPVVPALGNLCQIEDTGEHRGSQLHTQQASSPEGALVVACSAAHLQPVVPTTWRSELQRNPGVRDVSSATAGRPLPTRAPGRQPRLPEARPTG